MVRNADRGDPVLGGKAGIAHRRLYGKAMAIADLQARMAFLNRGQAWVVRKLEAMIPRVRECDIQDRLLAMLNAHRENIDRVEARLGAR